MTDKEIVFMKRLQALTAIVCAAAVLTTGIIPAGGFLTDAYAAETESTAEHEYAEDTSVPAPEEELSPVSEEADDAAKTAALEPAETEESETTDIEIPSVDSYEEVQEIAPADLDTASSYVVDLSSGEAEGSNAETVSVEEAFGIDRTDSSEAIVEAIQDTDVYVVDEAQTDDETAVVYAPYARHRIMVYTDEEITDTFGSTDAVYLTEDGGYRLCFESEEATKEAYDALTKMYGADAVVLDVAVLTSTVESEAKGWGTSYMHLDGISQEAQADGVDKAVTVAILDSGINSDHEVFKDKTISSKAYSVLGGSYADDNGHGTAVAGIIAESTSDNVVLMPIKIADEKGESSLDYMLQGLKYAAENGADVANLSMNACYKDTTLTDAQIKADIAALENKLQSYTSGGMVICVSAGNDARDIGSVYNYPAMSDYVLSVGSIGSKEQKSSFSSYGDVLDFTAPGEGVQCAWNDGTSSWKALSGTSMASPYIAASCAMILSTSSKSGMNEVEKELVSISKDLGTAGKDDDYGYGVPVFAETAVSDDNTQGTAQSEDAELVDGIKMPADWDPDDPGSVKALAKIEDSGVDDIVDLSASEDADIVLKSSTVSATSQWLGHPSVTYKDDNDKTVKKFANNKYNSSTKAYSGSQYITINHDSRNTTGKNIIPLIDVSYHNGIINWSAVKASGVEAVIIRCGYRSYAAGSVNEDIKFEENIKGAKNAGLKVGVYFFSQAITTQEAVEEANKSMEWIKETGQSLDLPLVIDIEHTPSNGRLAKANLSKTAQTNIAVAFCDQVKKYGYTPMVYASSSFLTGYMNAGTLTDKGIQIWMARYAADDSYTVSAYPNSKYYQESVEIWQCSSEAAVNGIASNPTDLNFWYQTPAYNGWRKDSTGWYWKNQDGTIMKSKWLKWKGYWYYLKANGYMAANEWAKDSSGWCWLGSGGEMATSAWIKSGGAWYYVNSSGHRVTNGWAKDSHGWCWLGSDGKIVKSKWIKTGGEWYYLKSNGYMAANEWAKDSHGWCYMASNGKIVKSKWIKWKGYWYYEKSNGYMAANEWARDSVGWCYLGANGKIVKSKWIKWKGYWYYLKSNGYMAANEYAKDSTKTYWMNSSGRISN